MPSGLLPSLPFFFAWLAVVSCPAQIPLNNSHDNIHPAAVFASSGGAHFVGQTNLVHASLSSAPLLRYASQETESVTELWSEAKAALDQGHFEEARRLLRQAVQQDPKDGALWFHLGVSCTEINDLDEAITAFERARALAPGRADTYFNLGLVYWKKGT